MAYLAQPGAGSNGSTVTNANATGFDQWNTVTASGAGTTITYDNAHVIHSLATSIKLHFATVASTDFTAWKASIASPVANAYGRFYIYRTADPSVAGTRISHMLTGAGAAAAAIQITTGGKLRIINSAGTNIATSSASLAMNAWTRVEWEITGISGTTGTITARFFTGSLLESGTPDETITSGAGAAVGGLVNEIRFGCSTSITQTTAWDAWISDMAFSDTATPGSVVTNLSPGLLVATSSFAAPAGAVSAVANVTIAGVLATLSMLAPVGAVDAVQNTSISGPVATASALALAGTVSATQDVTIGGIVATVTAAAPVGVVVIAAGGTGPTATITAAAPAGTVTVTANPTIAGPVATVTAQALPGLVTITRPDLILLFRSPTPAHAVIANPTLEFGEPAWDGVNLKIGPPGGADWNDCPSLTGVYAGPTDPGPMLPPGTEYVWAETDGAGTLLGINAFIA